MKKSLIMIIILFSSFSCLAQQVVDGNFMDRPRAVHFINQQTGFVAGGNSNFESELLRTTDSGNNWTTIPIFTNSYLLDIFVLDFNNFIVTGNTGIISKTTNSGYDWLKVYNNYSGGLGETYFVNETTGYTIGSGFFNPIFLKTTNRGYDWTPLPLDTNLDLYGVAFLNGNLGYVVGNRIIYKTTNGGNTIEKRIYEDYYLFSVTLIDSMTAYSAGKLTTGGSLILKTLDAGNSWFVNYCNTDHDALHQIKFLNTNFGIAVGNGGLALRTTNAGKNWEKHILVDTSILFDVDFIDNFTGWIVGQINPGGLLYKTTNAGENWLLQNRLTEIPMEFSLLQNYPNPFNPKTKIRYKLNTLSRVLLKVYDISGKEITKLADGDFDTGVYEIEFDGSNLASGIYFYKIDVTTLNKVVIESITESKKMVLIK